MFWLARLFVFLAWVYIVGFPGVWYFCYRYRPIESPEVWLNGLETGCTSFGDEVEEWLYQSTAHIEDQKDAD